MAEDIGLLLTLSKFVWPTQSLDFLHLTVDFIRMAVAIPADKAERILQDIQELLQLSKCKVKTVQVLAGHLNFITRVVPHGHPFSRKMYDLIAGMKPHWHICINKAVKRDLCIWKKFITEYGG